MNDTIHRRLLADGTAFRGDTQTRQATDSERADPARTARRWVAPLVAAMAVVGIAVGSVGFLGHDGPAGRASGAQSIGNAYPAPAPAVGRQITTNPERPTDPPVPATVIAEDAAVRQSVVAYRFEGQTCLKWQGPLGSSGGCGAPADEVMSRGVGPVLGQGGTASGSPAAWGSVPRTTTTVVINAADGTRQQVQAVDATPYGVNVYLARFDIVAHPLSSVAAYDATGRKIAEWKPPRVER